MVYDDMRIAFGTWAIGGGDSWGRNDEKDSIAALDAAISNGFTYFDTAPAYGNGLAETILGKTVKGRRDQVVIATKCGLEWGPSGSMLHKERDGVKVWRNLKKDGVIRQTEESLKRLGTDYIDILLTHWQCPVDPIEETIEALETLKKSGKIRAWGSCNNTPESIEGYFTSSHKPVLMQERWSLLENSKSDLISLAEREGVLFQAYSSMERGLLTGKLMPDDEIIGSAKKSDPWFRSDNMVKVNRALAPLKELAAYEHVPLHVLISAYALSLSPSMGLVLGARKASQAEENARLLSYRMSSDVKAEFEKRWVKPVKEES
ncbi:MAG: aldo/keto reductase [Bullifex sp.]